MTRSGSRDPDADSWDRYWAHGFLTSCADAFRGNYEGAIEACWADFFSVPEDGERILDVCTGNGAVAVLAARAARKRHIAVEIHGIDLAAIQPQAALKDDPESLAAIQFHPRTPADETRFSDAYFHYVCGQYALEYTPLDTTLAELARITAPGGRVQFLIHHTDSVVLYTARSELALGDWLFDSSGLFPAARCLIRRVGNTPQAQRPALASDPDAERERQAMNEAAARIMDAVATTRHPELLQNALGFVRRAYAALSGNGAHAAVALLDRGESELRANMARLEDLLRAAVAPQAMGRLQAKFKGQGFRLPDVSPLYHDGTILMGWRLLTERDCSSDRGII